MKNEKQQTLGTYSFDNMNAPIICYELNLLRIKLEINAIENVLTGRQAINLPIAI